ncbi:phosphatidate cytidylyltransferase [Martelella alba]|uniref:Phosphatidate cytidylyltransferase n=1 Tax=Martelella alba TaxID=2590451 RepID=A0A506UIB0_9HYPH|nr:phosphatidate cytidylyltransferase [Martelella alba]TPW33028.1 phosphatidate cytidylyltransferase [Martelella alba]
MQRELKLRILSGIVMAVVVLAAAWLGGLSFRLLSVLIGLLAYYEWSTMAGGSNGRLRPEFLIGWAGLLMVSALVLSNVYVPALLALCVAGVVLATGVVGRTQHRWAAGGLIYSGLIAIALASLRGEGQGGLFALLFLFAVVWTTDIAAYFVGRAIGGPKLAPAISPGKTWSGAIGGTLGGVVAGLAVVLISPGAIGPAFIGLSLLLSVVSQIGDLGESAMKRHFGVKDSSHLIPGHGGVMDRVDGLAVAAFVLFAVAAVLAGLHGGTSLQSAGHMLFGADAGLQQPVGTD